MSPSLRTLRLSPTDGSQIRDLFTCCFSNSRRKCRPLLPSSLEIPTLCRLLVALAGGSLTWIRLADRGPSSPRRLPDADPPRWPRPVRSTSPDEPHRRSTSPLSTHRPWPLWIRHAGHAPSWTASSSLTRHPGHLTPTPPWAHHYVRERLRRGERRCIFAFRLVLDAKWVL